MIGGMVFSLGLILVLSVAELFTGNALINRWLEGKIKVNVGQKTGQLVALAILV